MKNILRFPFGLISSLASSAGFVRMAEKFDPVSADVRSAQKETVQVMPAPCSLTCAEPVRLIRESA